MIGRIPLNVQTRLVVELQFKDHAGVQSKGGKDTIGYVARQIDIVPVSVKLGKTRTGYASSFI